METLQDFLAKTKSIEQYAIFEYLWHNTINIDEEGESENGEKTEVICFEKPLDGVLWGDRLFEISSEIAKNIKAAKSPQ